MYKHGRYFEQEGKNQQRENQRTYDNIWSPFILARETARENNWEEWQNTRSEDGEDSSEETKKKKRKKHRIIF